MAGTPLLKHSEVIEFFEYFEYSQNMSTTFIPEPALQEEYKKLSQALAFRKPKNGVAVLRGPDGHDISLPKDVYEILLLVLDSYQARRSISVIPHEAKMTTQEAADFLGVSRPTFISLAEKFELDLERVGRHRRVTMQALLGLQAALRVDRKKSLENIFNQNKELGLYNGDLEAMPPRK